MLLIFAIFALLLAFQLKHFLADYPLQGQFMLGKFDEDPWVWVPALSAHAAVHALGTALIVSWALFFRAKPITNWQAWDLIAGLAALDFVAHFVMDRIKADPDLMGRWKALSPRDYAYYKSCMVPGQHPNVYEQAGKAIRGNKFFWWALGFDQMVHHLTHYFIIFVLVAR